MSSNSLNRVDFFISYNGADEAWAEWVASILETNGYAVVLQKWDFRPGTNFVIGMDEAARRADRTLLILSKDSLASDFTAPEWAAAFVNDPQGSKAKLVPVRVDDCQPTGLLQSIVYIDLVGLGQDQAIARLIDGVGNMRRKPAGPVPFPGAATDDGPPASPLPSPAGHGGWTPLDPAPTVLWHAAGADRRYQVAGPTSLELHMVPVPSLRIEMRRLATLPDELITVGRTSGFFPNEAAVSKTQDANGVTVEVSTQPQRLVAGLGVTRDGQRSAWSALPSDSMGAVFDPVSLRTQVAASLSLLVDLDVASADRYGLAAAITATTLLTKAPTSVLGNRNRASMRSTGSDLVLSPEDGVTFAFLRHTIDAVAEELVARLEAAY